MLLQFGINEKDYTIFLEISKKLSDDHQIILVGLTNSQILKLPSHIIGIEKTNSIQELCILYALSDVFINLTYEDNYPTTNLESISCGTPVITYKTGGSTESAEIFGKTVEKGNIELVIEEIKSCKNYYRNNKFNMDNQDTVKEYLKIYKGK